MLFLLTLFRITDIFFITCVIAHDAKTHIIKN